MANNPLYPGYSPKKEGGGSVNPLYPGYYTGNPISKRPDWRGSVPPAEYSFDIVLEGLDEVGDKVSGAPLAGPKWIRDRIVDDWKKQLKVSVTPEANLDVTELDDFSTDDIAGATTELSLNPKDWGIGNKKGFEQTKKQIIKTLDSWTKETTGINRSDILKSDFSEIQNNTNEVLWRTALGYGKESAGFLEEIGAGAVADRTTARFSDVRESAYRDKGGKRLSPLDLKHKQEINETGETVIVEDKDNIYGNTVAAVAEFIRNRDSAQSRDKLHTKFLSTAVKDIREEIKGDFEFDRASPKQKAAIDLFNNKVEILDSVENFQKKIGKVAENLERETVVIKDKWRVDSNRGDKKQEILEGAAKTINKERKALEEYREKIKNLDSSLIPEREFNFLSNEIDKYQERIDKLEKIIKHAGSPLSNTRDVAKRLKGSTPKSNFTSRTTFQDSLGGNLRRDLEKSVLSKKDHDIGSVLNAEGTNLRAKKLAPVVYRLRQDRIHFATKEILDQFEKGGLAQVAETYAWKAIKNRLPAILERVSSGSIVGDTLKRTNYFGLKIDERGTPTDEYFEKNWWTKHVSKASFDRKYLNKMDVNLDKDLKGLVGQGVLNKIKVTGNDVSKDRLKYLENLKGVDKSKIASLSIIGDGALKKFKFDKVVEDQVLLARLINNDRSEDALNKLAKKMFGSRADYSNLDDDDRKEFGEFLTKINYANNWVYQKSEGKIKALDMQQRGVLKLDDLKTRWSGLKIDKLYVSQGKHLDIFKNDILNNFLNSSTDENDKIKLLKALNYAQKFPTDAGNRFLRNTISKKLFGKKLDKLSASEISDLESIISKFSDFSKYLAGKESMLGMADTADKNAFVIQMFLQFKKQDIQGFKAINVDQNDKSFLLIKNIFQKNDKLNSGYKLTDKRYMGRLERLNNRMQTLQKKWNKSRIGKIIKFFKNWQEIIAEKTIALLSKLLAKLTGMTAAALGPLAELGPIIQAIAEKVIKRGLEYASSFIKAIYKLDFGDLDKMLQEDFNKILQLLLVSCSCLLLLALPVMFLLTIVYSVANPVDNTRTYFDGYGATNLPTSGEPDPRVFGCGGMCGGMGECKEFYGSDTFTSGSGLGGFYYSQFDPRWANVPIGNSTSLIGRFGCLVTSVAMVYTYFGQPTTPDVIAGQTYRYEGANMRNKEVEGATKVNLASSESAMIDFFKEHPGGIIILGLWVNPGGGSTQHYMVISGYDSSQNQFILYDPARGPDACLRKEYTHQVLVAYGYYSEDGAVCVVGPEPGDPYNINCGLESDPICANKPSASTSDLANLALDIACSLKPGFDCLFNYPDSSTMDSKYSHSGNVITNPGGYAFLWDQNVYDKYVAGEISESQLHNYGVALYWCTWLPTKVYNALRGEQYGSAWYPPGQLSLSADTMCWDFQKGHLGFDWVTDNPEPGDIVCFDWGTPDGDYDHVGIVYSVHRVNGVIQGVYTVESNAGNVYNYWSKSGASYAPIMGFGRLP